ncbi:MAG: hypothetical protein JST17_04595 [Bacteroidetes bacterium]|nr:hypothetical protein [Bacteroidota bacterium]MBS1929688.1 hypothetical protein [Bacteroidota bacterium]
MSNLKAQEKVIRYTLGFLLALLSLNAFAGGYYGIAGAENVPLEWLEGSPFSSYFIPSLILLVCVGGSSLFACIVVFMRHRIATKASCICGMITLLWLTVQIAIIGYVSWMQPVTVIGALIILFLSSKLSKYAY